MTPDLDDRADPGLPRFETLRESPDITVICGVREFRHDPA
jgi:hypothetical protein